MCIDKSLADGLAGIAATLANSATPVGKKPRVAKAVAKKAKAKVPTKVKRAMAPKAVVAKPEPVIAVQPVAPVADVSTTPAPFVRERRLRSWNVGVVVYDLPAGGFWPHTDINSDIFYRYIDHIGGFRVEINILGHVDDIMIDKPMRITGHAVIREIDSHTMPLRVNITRSVEDETSETRLGLARSHQIERNNIMQSAIQLAPDVDAFILLTELDEAATTARFVAREERQAA